MSATSHLGAEVSPPHYDTLGVGLEHQLVSLRDWIDNYPET